MSFYIIAAAAAAIMLFYYMKKGKPVASALKGMASGGISLLVVHFFGGYLGFYLPLNFFTAFVSLVLGAPAVIIMTLIEKFLL